tara:strand:- start:1534 stop:3228 length:1695 start_codon:yes stop_codon:yes gene_type:complete
MYQRLEKDISVINSAKTKNSKILVLLGLALMVGPLFGQIDNRFNVFSWEQYASVGAVNSISEDYTYFYFGTENAGILRLNKFSQQFVRPISQTQGIKSNSIEHVYFDEHTGILWSVGDKFIEYSFSREGGWTNISYDLISLKSGNQIIDIGSSKDYLWLRSNSRFFKLDHVNGILLGIYAAPDESSIDWGDTSSRELRWRMFDFNDYFVEDAWLLTSNGASDNRGNFSKYLSYYESDNRLNWISLSNGYILKIDEFNKLITPIFYGLSCAVPTSIIHDEVLWVSGIGNKSFNGITKLDIDNNKFENILSDNYLNFNKDNIYSSIMIDSEIWFGLDSYVVVYNIKKDSFRTIGFEKGIPSGKIIHLEHRNGSIFAGSINGVVEIDINLKTRIDSAIEKFAFSRNLFLGDIEAFEDKTFFVLSNSVFVYENKNNKVSSLNWEDVVSDNLIKKSQVNIVSRSVSRLFSANSNLYMITDLGIIDYNDGSLLIPSSIYFNYKITDLVVSDNSLLFLSTPRGLFIFDLETSELINYYDFPFLRNIYQMEYISEYLLLLTSKGLIKFNINL